MAAVTMLDVTEISIGYGGRAILSDVSFTLRAGEIVALLGPNGAGKTSLIRSLNGTVPIAAGTIKLFDAPLSSYSRREIAKKIAVVAQENETKFPVTVMEFVLSGRFALGRAFGWEGMDDVRSAERALEECDLKEYAGRLMNELSGGERQRVVLARALAAETDVLLLDEPTANLDLANQTLMFNLVRNRCRSAGSSAVIITHDLNLASEFADRIIMLNAGKIFAQGTPADTLTAGNVREVFGVSVLLDRHPASSKLRITAIY